MFKWLFALIVAFFAAWLFAKIYIPDSIKKSNFGEAVDLITFPAEYKIKKQSYKGGKFDDMIVELDNAKLRRALENAQARNNPVVMYFYRSNCILCRKVFKDLNEFAKIYSQKKVLFFAVAFDDNRSKLSFFLNSLEWMYLRPYVMPASELKTAEYVLARNNVRFDDTPVLIYKSQSRIYQNVGIGFGTKEKLKELVEGDK